MKRRSITRIGFTAVAGAAAFALATACASTDPNGGTGSAGDSGMGDGSGMDGSGTIEGTAIPEPSADFQTVYFDYDSSEIRADMRPLLQENASLVGDRGGSWSSVTIEGHCDERGSEEYNLALGERRASSVKRYLVDLGVPSSMVNTVSFGEERPAVQGHDESAWKWNRRVEFGVNR